MATLYEVITNAAVWGSIALLLWGGTICLGEFFAFMFKTRVPHQRQDREDSGPSIATLSNQGK